MPTSAQRFVAVLCALAGLAGCTPKDTNTGAAKGEVRVRLPLLGKDGVTKIGERSLGDIDNLNEVTGKYARFVFAPKITSEGLVGFAPHARFVKAADGVFVPADEQSQHLAAIYAEFEQLYLFDQKLGVENLLAWPRVVGFSVRILNGSSILTDNAFYDGASDATLVVPYKDGHLPLAMNPGVLAHEHFHSLFDRLVVRPLLQEKLISRRMSPSAHAEKELAEYFEKIQQKAADIELDDAELDERLYNTVLLKSVNEGLADVWGWVRTGDMNFVGRSLPAFTVARTLEVGADETPVPLLDKKSFRDILASFSRTRRAEMLLNDFAYRPGTQLARALIHTVGADRSDLSNEEFRQEVGALVIRALPELVKEFREKSGRGDPRSIFNRIIAQKPLSAEQKAMARRWVPGESR